MAKREEQNITAYNRVEHCLELIKFEPLIMPSQALVHVA